VQGKGFIPYSFVVLNGQKLKTEYVDRWHLRATVPAELFTLGTFPVTVENPNFGTPMLPHAGNPELSRPFDHVSNTVMLLVAP
jgi:hypothetical protein